LNRFCFSIFSTFQMFRFAQHDNSRERNFPSDFSLRSKFTGKALNISSAARNPMES